MIFGIGLDRLVILAIVIIDLSCLLIIILVPGDRRPTAAMAWILAVILIPVLGALFFWLIGETKLPRRWRAKQENIDQLILETTHGVERVSDSATWPEWFHGVVQLNRNLGSMPLIGSNSATLIGDYRESITAMTEAIQDAKRHVHAEFYILSYDSTTASFFEAVREAVVRGVTVRILFDHVATLRVPGYRRTLRELRATGAQWHPMLPIQPFRGKYQRPDFRNHRKLLVVDESVGFLGSQNMIDSHYHRRKNLRRGLTWQDVMARFEGPVVAGIDVVFASDWYLTTGDSVDQNIGDALEHGGERQNLDCQLLPSGPGYRHENNLKLFLALLYAARRRVVIASPYFVPDEALLYAISGATQRGVHVELFVSEIGDQALVYHAQRSYYEALLRAGVDIYMYPAPYILHAKHVTVDEDVAVIGSSNLDIRSFMLNMEVSMLVRGASFVRDLRAIEDGYRSKSHKVTLDEWLMRPVRSKFLDNLARLTSALQ